MTPSRYWKIRSSVEQLETRDTPSVATVYETGFDQLQPPVLPSDWSAWSNDGQQAFLTSRLAATSGSNSLSSIGNSSIQSRYWHLGSYGQDFGASASLRADTPVPIEVIARGTGLNTNKPNYVSATYRFGGQIELVEVRDGVRNLLGTVRTQAPIYSGWIKLTVLPSGEWVGVQVQRVDTGAYLAANGSWQSSEVDALRLKVVIAPSGGNLGIGRVAGSSGNAFVDDFAVLSPPGVTESFDTQSVGVAPSGWKTWASDGTGKATVGTTRAESPRNALSTSGNSTTAVRGWVTNAMPADVRATVSIFADSLIPAGVIVRGGGLDTTKPSFYSATVTRGLDLQLRRTIDGVETVLGRLKSRAYTSQLWVQVTLAARGGQLQASVFRPDTRQWLGADGNWKAAEEAALTVNDNTITASGLVGIQRVRAVSGTVWLDNFLVRPIQTVTLRPSVSVIQSQTGTVSGIVSFVASATPAASVSRVEFVLDGTLRSTQTVANARWEIDTRTLSNGRHELVVRAVDALGNIGVATVNFDVLNAAPPPAPVGVQKYSHIRIAQLAYSGNPMGTYEQNLAAQSLDLVVANPQFLGTLDKAAPTTPTVIYTNLSNLYDDLLTGWLNYADRVGVSRELAFYHVTQATAFSGMSPSSRPVNWLWNVSSANVNGTGAITDFTANARGGRVGGVPFGAAGQAITFAFTDRFRELNFVLNRPAGAGWQGVFEYVTKVDANGNPTEWRTLPLVTDATNSFRNDGRITFDPPANWVAAKNPNGTDRLFQVRFRTNVGSASVAPEARTVFGRDYVNAAGGQTGTIPAFDTTADLNGDGYLSDAEYAKRRAGFDARFEYESRLFYPYYGQMRFVTNPSSSALQTWAADYHVELLKKYPLADGFFIDNANGRLPFAGTSVREVTSGFTAESAALVKSVTTKIAPKWVVTNTAGSRADGNPVAGASTAAFEEFLLRPNDVTWSGVLDVASLVAGRLGSANPSPYVILDSHPGRQPTTDDRTRSSTLAYYYLLADPTKTFLMFYGGYKPSAAWSSVFVPAATIDVGRPTGAMTVFQTGQDPANPALKYQIYRRDYGNAIVLFKPLSYTLGKGTGTNADASATVVQLGGSYRVLNADGTRGPVITSISLRNAEGVVLMKA